MGAPRVQTALLGLICITAASPSRADIYDACVEEYDEPLAYWSFDADSIERGTAYLDEVQDAVAIARNGAGIAPGIAGEGILLETRTAKG